MRVLDQLIGERSVSELQIFQINLCMCKSQSRLPVIQGKPGIQHLERGDLHGLKSSFVFCSSQISLNNIKGQLQGLEFSDYSNFSHLFLHSQPVPMYVDVILKGAKAMENIARSCSSCCLHVFPQLYLIMAVLFPESNLFLVVNFEVLAQNLTWLSCETVLIVTIPTLQLRFDYKNVLATKCSICKSLCARPVQLCSGFGCFWCRMVLSTCIRRFLFLCSSFLLKIIRYLRSLLLPEDLLSLLLLKVWTGAQFKLFVFICSVKKGSLFADLARLLPVVSLSLR